MAMQRLQSAACVIAILPLLLLPASGRLSLQGAHRTRHENETRAEVTAEAAQDIQISEIFAAQEKQDVESEAAHSGKDEMSAVQEDVRQGPALCDNIVCGTLHCPGDFAPTKIDGHCCPYCVSPTVKYAEGVQGASGEFGGEPSSFCANVWCFPTMCTTPPVAPSTENGLCCEQCAS